MTLTSVPDASPQSRRASPWAPAIDIDAAEQAVSDLLAALGVEAGSETALRTPVRMVAGLVELLTPADWEMTTFPNAEAQHDLVLVRDIPFTSVCAHHLLPFSGRAHVGVLPGERIVGLSKLARTVHLYAARLQVQEDLGQQIADRLERELSCAGVGVVLEAEHLCMTRRGVRALGSTTTTISTRGQLHERSTARSEFLQFASSGRLA